MKIDIGSKDYLLSGYTRLCILSERLTGSCIAAGSFEIMSEADDEGVEDEADRSSVDTLHRLTPAVSQTLPP